MFRLRNRILMWGTVVLALPLVARLFHDLADVLESRGAPVVVHRGLHHAGGGLEVLRSTLRR